MMTYILSNSSKPEKKLMVKFLNDKTGNINTVHFGATGYDDYTITKNDAQKLLYQKRHADDYINDLNYAGAWSMNLLWNKKTLNASIKDMEKRFGIKITRVQIRDAVP